MTTPIPLAPSALSIDPDVQAFCQQVGAAFATYPDFSLNNPVRAREIAEEVRAPWRQGGPVMHSTVERLIPTGAGEVRVRIYNPSAGAHPKRALVYMHGGGWVIFSLDTHDRIMREYAARADVIVIGVDYALAPEARFPIALEQVVGVIEWLAQNGAQLGIATNRIAAGGDSAGANLALAAAIKLRDSAPEILRALLLNYGAFSSHSSPEAARTLGAKGAMLEHAEMQQFWATYLRNPEDANDPLACPLQAQVKGLPPAFLTIPELDLLTEQSLALAGKFRAANITVHAQIYPGATHSFLEAVSIAPVAARALEDGARWLIRATRGQPNR